MHSYSIHIVFWNGEDGKRGAFLDSKEEHGLSRIDAITRFALLCRDITSRNNVLQAASLRLVKN